jgi:uncharacterized protein YdeI (YjbR/CyaY-like superfamily)
MPLCIALATSSLLPHPEPVEGRAPHSHPLRCRWEPTWTIDQMNQPTTLHVTTRNEWRAWLAEHHDTEKEVWLISYKKHTGRPQIPYDEAVEEALCFGWIDSLVKTIDEERFAQKFTPRKMKNNWSESNKRRVKKLVREGRMTQAGLSKIKGVLEDNE